MDGSGKARLTDFGLSAIWADKALTFASMTNTPFDRSIRWTAPELLEVGKVPNQASDIWAFGGVCYEVRVMFFIMRAHDSRMKFLGPNRFSLEEYRSMNAQMITRSFKGY